MPIHKIILGGEQYLGFALNKLRRLALLAEGIGGYASQHFELGDASISLRIANEQQFLRIEGSRPRYEFFTSDHSGYDSYNMLKARYPGDPSKWVHGFAPGTPGTGNIYEITDDPATPGFLMGIIDGSFTNVSFAGKAKPLPVLSLSLPPPTDPNAKNWVKIAQDDKVYWPHSRGLPKGTRVTGLWQTSGIFEYESWPGNSGKSMMQSTRALPVGRGSTCNWSSGGANSAYIKTDVKNAEYEVNLYEPGYSTDTGRDIPPTYITAKRRITKGPDYPEPGRWWRRAGVTRSDKGNLFFICTDNIGRVQVYRVQAKQERDDPSPIVEYRVQPGAYLDSLPPYPSWVTTPGGPDNIAQPGKTPVWRQAFWSWAFSKDGSRMAACPFHSEASTFYKSRDIPYGVASTFHADAYSRLTDEQQEELVKAREDIPGLVEFGIKITEYGEGDMDFSVDFTLLREDYFNDSGRYPLEVEYALPGVEGVEEDTLLVSSIECKYPAGNYFANAVDDPIEPLPAAGYPEVLPLFIHNTRFARADLVVDSVTDDGWTRLRSFTLRENLSFRFFDFENDPTPSLAGLAVTNSFVAFSTRSRRDPSPLGDVVTFIYGYPDTPQRYGNTLRPDDETEWVKRVFGRINASDLRSLSFEYQVFSDFDNRAFWQLSAFGKVEEEFSAPFDPADIDASLFGGSRSANTLLPKAAALKLCRFLSRDAIETYIIGTGFCVHPKGHWAYCQSSGSSGTFDIVQPKGGKRTSHKALYNEAFGQSRDYSYYTEPYTDCFIDKDTGGVLDGTEIGTFRSYGYWTTF